MDTVESVNTTDADKIYTFEVTSSQNLETLAKTLESWEKLSQAMQKQAHPEEWGNVLSDFRFACTILHFDILTRLSLIRTVAKYVSYFFSTDRGGKLSSLFVPLSSLTELFWPSRYIVAVNDQGKLLAIASAYIEEETIDGNYLVTNPSHHKLCPGLENKVRGAASALLIHAAKTYPEKSVEIAALETSNSFYKARGYTEVTPDSFKILASELLRFTPPPYLQKAVPLQTERTISRSLA